jgi:heat shock protein HslJ
MLNRSVSRMAWLPLVLVLGACGGGSQDLVSATPVPPATSTGGQAAGQSSSDLLGVWRLVSLQASGGAVVEVKTPDSFTAHFGSDGRVALVADCNRCNAGYAASRDGIQVGPMACTRAYCTTAPLDTDFAGLVSGAAAWSVEGSELTLTSTEGTLHLKR